MQIYNRAELAMWCQEVAELKNLEDNNKQTIQQKD